MLGTPGDGNLTVLRSGTNDWICVPGDENIVGATDMCLDPMGMVWMGRERVPPRRPRCMDHELFATLATYLATLARSHNR